MAFRVSRCRCIVLWFSLALSRPSCCLFWWSYSRYYYLVTSASTSCPIKICEQSCVLYCPFYYQVGGMRFSLFTSILLYCYYSVVESAYASNLSIHQNHYFMREQTLLRWQESIATLSMRIQDNLGMETDISNITAASARTTVPHIVAWTHEW